MALIKKCNRCGEEISIRKMPHGKWVSFQRNTGTAHRCKKKTHVEISQNSYLEVQSKNNINSTNNNDFNKTINIEEEMAELERLKNLKEKENYEIQNLISGNLEIKRKNISKIKWIVFIFFGYLLLYWIMSVN